MPAAQTKPSKGRPHYAGNSYHYLRKNCFYNISAEPVAEKRLFATRPRPAQDKEPFCTPVCVNGLSKMRLSDEWRRFVFVSSRPDTVEAFNQDYSRYGEQGPVRVTAEQCSFNCWARVLCDYRKKYISTDFPLDIAPVFSYEKLRIPYGNQN